MTTLWTVAWMCKHNGDSGQLPPTRTTRASAERLSCILNETFDIDVHWAQPVVVEVDDDYDLG